MEGGVIGYVIENMSSHNCAIVHQDACLPRCEMVIL